MVKNRSIPRNVAIQAIMYLLVAGSILLIWMDRMKDNLGILVLYGASVTILAYLLVSGRHNRVQTVVNGLLSLGLTFSLLR